MGKKKNKQGIFKFNFKDIIKDEKFMMVCTGIATVIIGITFYLVFINNTGKAISNLKFTSIMEDKGLKIYDVTDQFGEDYVKSATIAYNEKTNYQIEFIVFSDDDSAKNAFNLNKNTFEKIKTDTSEEVSTSNEKISEYALTTEDKYMYISRRKNTLIYLNIDGSYKIEVANLITKIGY
jgi:hypothetical protein